VHATRPGRRGHARLEFSEKLVHCGARYRVPTRVTKMRDASAHRDQVTATVRQVADGETTGRMRRASPPTGLLVSAEFRIEAAGSTELAKPGDYRSASTLRTYGHPGQVPSLRP
jgi:hypothetical protein